MYYENLKYAKLRKYNMASRIFDDKTFHMEDTLLNSCHLASPARLIDFVRHFQFSIPCGNLVRNNYLISTPNSYKYYLYTITRFNITDMQSFAGIVMITCRLKFVSTKHIRRPLSIEKRRSSFLHFRFSVKVVLLQPDLKK
jgi:hypothetical protein